MFGKKTLKIDSALWDKISQYASAMGYASADEFIIHTLEKELTSLESADTDEDIKNRLKGLGYIE